MGKLFDKQIAWPNRLFAAYDQPLLSQMGKAN
jgi:hypothetical protein